MEEDIDILKFISKKIRNQVPSLSMRKLIADLQLTKSTFYRFMQEPWRLSDTEIAKLADILMLNEADRVTLEKFRIKRSKNVSENTSNPDSEINIDEERSEIYDFLYSMIFENSSTIHEDYHSNYYSLFDSDNDSRIIKCSADDIANIIVGNSNINEPSAQTTLSFTVYNTYSSKQIPQLFSLIKRVYEIKAEISVKHYINVEGIENISKFRAFADLKCLYDFDNYKIIFSEQLGASALANLDCFLLEYTGKFNKPIFLYCVFPTDGDANLFSFENRSLFTFLKHKSPDVYRLQQNDPAPNVTDAISMNTYMTICADKFPKATINPTLCIDNLSYDIFDIVEKNLLNAPEEIQEAFVQNVLKNSNIGTFNTVESITTIFESCKKRVQINEDKNAITLLFTKGLNKLAEFGYIAETEYIESMGKFDDSIILMELNYIKKNLGASHKGQQYYIIGSAYDTSYFFGVYRNHLLQISNMDNVNSLITNSFLLQQDMSIFLYDYIHDCLISNKQRKKPNSPVYTDERAAQFIDSLITFVENRMNNESKR